MNKKIILILLSIFFSFLLSSCGELGYSLVLWNNQDAGVSEGQIVKVYVKSNISQTYIISLLEDDHKVEIPLWQISEPTSKKKTVALARTYEEFAHTYARVKLDGLPIRFEPVNTSKQVYRLRKDEVIRVLYKGKGQSVTNGKGNLNGEWLRVLTGSGTFGWCFSYNLALFERTDKTLSTAKETKKQELDEALQSALVKRWYPEYFSEMIKTGRFDLDRLSSSYGFFFGTETAESEDEIKTDDFDLQETSDFPLVQEGIESVSIEAQEEVKESETVLSAQALALDETLEKTLRILTADLQKEWTYTKISKNSDGAYAFDENQVYVTLRGKNSMVVQYMDSDGKMKNENFIALDIDLKEVIKREVERRNALIQSFVDAGPVYHSSNYGTLTFKEGGEAVWRNYKLLVPSVISSSAREKIKVTAEYYLSSSLKKEFDGILTFTFEGSAEKINFFYKKDSSGLRLEDAKRAGTRGNLVNARSSSPLVMYFTAR